MVTQPAMATVWESGMGLTKGNLALPRDKIVGNVLKIA